MTSRSLQHRAVAPAALEQLEQRTEIGAAHAHGAREREALGRGERVARRQLLVDELGLLP